MALLSPPENQVCGRIFLALCVAFWDEFGANCMMRMILLHRFSQVQRQQLHAATFYDASLQMTLSARSERAFVYIAGHFSLMIALF